MKALWEIPLAEHLKRAENSLREKDKESPNWVADFLGNQKIYHRNAVKRALGERKPVPQKCPIRLSRICLSSPKEQQARLLHVDGRIEPVQLKDGSCFSLAELQSFVGGYFEILRPESNHGVLLIINGEGKPLHLPPNALASALWASVALADDFIVGPALLCHPSMIK